MPAVDGSTDASGLGTFSYVGQQKARYECYHCGFETWLYEFNPAERQCPICKEEKALVRVGHQEFRWGAGEWVGVASVAMNREASMAESGSVPSAKRSEHSRVPHHTEYRILTSYTAMVLEASVKDYLKDGWKPQGGLSHWNGTWSQAMVKDIST